MAGARPVSDAADAVGLVMGIDPGTPDGDQPAVVFIRPDGTVIPASEMTDAERASCEHLAEERSRFKW